MKKGLNMEAKNEITKTYAKQYQKLSKKKKSEVLDNLCKLTGWDRKYAIRKLKNSAISSIHKRKKRRKNLKRKKKYPKELEHMINLKPRFSEY